MIKIKSNKDVLLILVISAISTILYVLGVFYALSQKQVDMSQQISLNNTIVVVEDKIENVENPYLTELSELLLIKDTLTIEQYYISFKEINGRYDKKYNNIYDKFTKQELDLIFNVVEVEAEEGGFIEKCNVASVIFNRLDSELFPNSISEVLVKSQFSSIGVSKFNNIEISESTILACEYAYVFGDITGGCLFFDSCDYMAHSSYADYVFTDNIGHKFYK